MKEGHLVLSNKYFNHFAAIASLSIFIAFSSCNDLNEQKNKSNSFDSTTKQESLRPNKIKYKKLLDTSISQIVLSNEESVIKSLGDISNSINWESCECITIVNGNQTEYLQLHHENGGRNNSYDIFVVGYLKNLDFDIKFAKKTEIDFFRSENNIYLGLPEETFLNIYYDVQFKSELIGDVKKYFFHDVENTYLAEYWFTKGKLIEFRIGYDNS